MDQRADFTCGKPFLCPLPLRVMHDHVGLCGQQSGAVTGGNDLVDLARFHRDRLFGQDMLAGRQRLQRPFDMHVVRQRDVDRVDGRIGQKRLIAVMHGKPGTKGAEPRRLLRVRGRQRGQFGPFCGMDGRGHVLTREIGGPKDAPSDRFHHSPPNTGLRRHMGRSAPVIQPAAGFAETEKGSPPDSPCKGSAASPTDRSPVPPPRRPVPPAHNAHGRWRS